MCGGVKYEFTGEPAATALCHCVDCQKWSGSAYTSNVIVPRVNHKITAGEKEHLKAYDIVGLSGKVNKHLFCGTCGSSLWTEAEVLPEVFCIKAGGLDGGKADLDVGTEYFTRDRVSFATPIKGANQEKLFL